MGWAHVDPLFQFGMYPAAREPAAGEDERVGAPVPIDHGELKIALVRRGRYRLPHEPLCAPGVASNLI